MTRIIQHFCRECGKQVDDFCAEHPHATVESVPVEADPNDTLIQTRIRETARAYAREFDTLILDSEWSGTAYEDLPGAARERITWREFHNAVQGTLEA
jgi:hypothetical protein